MKPVEEHGMIKFAFWKNKYRWCFMKGEFQREKKLELGSK